jgi:FkbM family methyltransferase
LAVEVHYLPGYTATVKQLLRRILRRFGVDIVRFNSRTHPLARRAQLLVANGINLVLDVGANVGWYGHTLREIGYRGRIVSFEPLSAAYQQLSRRAQTDRFAWRALNLALGATDTTSEINIAGNSQSSSFFDMLPAHLQAATISKYVGKERVTVRRLDSLFSEICSADDRILLKIDTQGYEKNVLDGANNSLPHIRMVQLEMSLTPLYQNELLFDELHTFLKSKGLMLVSLEPGFADCRTGQLLQVDGIYQRAGEPPSRTA